MPRLGRRLLPVAAGGVAVIALASAAPPPQSSGDGDQPGPMKPTPVESLLWTQMQNVHLRIDSTTASTIQIRSLHGEVVLLAGTVPSLDNPKSFKIRVTSANIALDGPALS